MSTTHPALGSNSGAPADGAFSRLLRGAGFGLYVLFVLLFSTLLTAALLLVPASESGLGAFARDFRALCLSADGTGAGVPIAAVLTVLLSPFLLALFVVLIWARPLATLRGRGARPLALPAALALATVFTAAAGLVAANPPPDGQANLAFPAEGLRTSFDAPEFSLTNQEGRTVSLADLRGRVVVLTSVYAHCPAACPMIFAQAKRAVSTLSAAELEAFQFVAITMDPERDSPQVLAELAAAQGLDPATWQLLTGPPATVETVLDRMGVARAKDPESGLIEHANLYLVLDRKGKVAYSFALGELQEKWLAEALHLLIAEPPPAA